MRIHVLTPVIPKNPDSPLKVSLDLLVHAASERGHSLHMIETSQCKMVFGPRPYVLVDSKKPKLEVLITKASFSGANADVHASLIKQFELTGIPVINTYKSVIRAKNKVRALQRLSQKNIPIPKTYAIRSSEYISEVVEAIGKFPIILKKVSGYGGIGVAIIESKRGLKSIVEMMIEDDTSNPLIVQEYVRESRGKDIRVMVVGGKIIAAMDRIATVRGEFRSNFTIGGKVKIAELSDDEKRLAKRAAKAMELDFAGVDIIRSKDGPKILEVNSNPGLKGITQATGIDVAGAIIEYAVQRAKEYHDKEE